MGAVTVTQLLSRLSAVIFSPCVPNLTVEEVCTVPEGGSQDHDGIRDNYLDKRDSDRHISLEYLATICGVHGTHEDHGEAYGGHGDHGSRNDVENIGLSFRFCVYADTPSPPVSPQQGTQLGGCISTSNWSVRVVFKGGSDASRKVFWLLYEKV